MGSRRERSTRAIAIDASSRREQSTRAIDADKFLLFACAIAGASKSYLLYVVERVRERSVLTRTLQDCSDCTTGT